MYLNRCQLNNVCILDVEKKVTNSIAGGRAIYTTYTNISARDFGANSMEYKPRETIRI